MISEVQAGWLTLMKFLQKRSRKESLEEGREGLVGVRVGQSTPMVYSKTQNKEEKKANAQRRIQARALQVRLVHCRGPRRGPRCY